jgi:hypothetical protein
MRRKRRVGGGHRFLLDSDRNLRRMRKRRSRCLRGPHKLGCLTSVGSAVQCDRKWQKVGLILVILHPQVPYFLRCSTVAFRNSIRVGMTTVYKIRN